MSSYVVQRLDDLKHEWLRAKREHPRIAIGVVAVFGLEVDRIGANVQAGGCPGKAGLRAKDAFHITSPNVKAGDRRIAQVLCRSLTAESERVDGLFSNLWK